MNSSGQDEQKQQEKFLMMTQAPVKKLVLKMAAPTIVSMMVTAVYNVVDAAFVAHLSTEAAAGVGVAFAYMTFVQAIGFFCGHGSGNYISRSLGAQQIQNAEKMAATGFFSALLTGLLIGTAGLLFLSPLSHFLGATPEITGTSNQYLRFILLATPLMMSGLVMNNQLRLQGSAQYAMIGLASGAILNMLLDPLFIFVLDWGVSGASAATLCSQLFSWVLLFLGTKRAGNVHIQLRNFTPKFFYYKEITRGGLPSLCRQGLICISTICLNRMASQYAAPGMEASTIAAFAIVSRIMMLSFAIILGLGQGFQPVCGFNYGAKLFQRVKKSYTFCMSVSTLILLVLATLGFVFAPQLISLFRQEDAALIAIGTKVLRWQCIVFPLCGITTPTNMLFQTTGHAFKATLLSVCRQGLFFLPTLYISAWFFGLQGLMATQAVADLLTFCFTLPFGIQVIRKLNQYSQKGF